MSSDVRSGDSRSRRHVEDFIMADIDPASRGPDIAWGLTKSAWSYREFGKLLEEAAKTTL